MLLLTFQYIICFLVGIVTFTYIFLINRYKYWKNKNVYTPDFKVPFGHAGEMVKGKQQIGILFSNVYKETKKHPYVGLYMIHRPYFVVNDLEIIKKILVSDFLHFNHHGFQYDEDKEPIDGHLFNATGDMWKYLRTKLTPTFTSNKMKLMFETLKDCNSQMLIYLENNVKKENEIELKELFSKLNTDVIGNCAFGIECNSFTDPDSEFRKMGRKIFEPNILSGIVRSLNFLIYCKFTTWLKQFVDKFEIQNFFYNLVNNTIKYREENNIYRKDFLQLLIELQQKGSVNDETTDKNESSVDDGTRLTTMQLAAQVFVFFIAGFETSSTTASFALYEMAMNPDIQDSVREDINKVLEQNNGNITYESLLQMTLLTKVIEETLRKYPPLPVLFRMCTKEYKIPNTDIIIEKDTPVMIPIYGIQRDPEYYPDPDKFDPERFSPENKASRNHFTHLPFGEGPRICIGNRFGMMQTRLGLISVLSKYKVSPCDKTLIPMDYDKRNFILSSDGGTWLKLTKIENQ